VFDTVFSSAAMRCKDLAADLGCLFHRALAEHETRRTLHALPDDLLRDVGLNRSEIDFVAGALASGRGDPTRHARDGVNAASRRAPGCKGDRSLPQGARSVGLAVVLAAFALFSSSGESRAQDAQVKRGQYLVTICGCNDCHTPGYFFGKPAMARFLGGSEVGFEIPGLGVFHGRNLTPDPETGLGKWSTDEIAAAITKGQRPDGRILAPIMPWHAFANLTRQDVRAIVAFLKSLPPVKNKVPGPFGPSEKPTSFVMKIVPPETAAPAGSAPK